MQLVSMNMVNFRRAFLIAVTFLFIRRTEQVKDLPPSQQCEGVVDQLIDAENLRIAYKASILSALAYLEYEKNPRDHPWEVSFESTNPTLLNTIKFTLARKLCVTRSFFKRLSGHVTRFFSKLPLIGVYFKDRSAPNRSTSNYLISDECRSVGRHRDSIVLRWFFADWREGLWHDTEVLLGESETTAFIIFRGSDSAADLITNSQTLEPATHSNYFGSQNGSIHRGMLNAYSRVDKGRLFALDRRIDDKTAFGTHISDTFELFKNLQKTSNDAADGVEKNENSSSDSKSGFFQGKQKQGPTASPTKSKSNEDNTDNFVTVSNTLLSNLLINSVLSALKTGKEVVLAGHSLGGSLALLLALDTLVNHTYETSSNNASSSYDHDEKNGKKENMYTKNKKSKNDSDSYQTNGGRSSDNRSEDTPPTPSRTSTSTSTYKSNSYSHHNDKRCTSTAHVSVLDGLHIVTFGQPELADPLFFEGLKMQHSAAKKLLEERYTKVISLSQAPQCHPDIVTQLVTKVGDVIGDWLLGSKKDFKEKIKSEISDRMIKTEKMAKSTAKITWNTEGGKVSERPKSSGVSADDSDGDSGSDNGRKVKNTNIKGTESAIVSTVVNEVKEVKEMEELIKKKNRKEKKKKGYFNMRNEPKIKKIDEDTNKNTNESENRDENIDKINGTNKKNSKKIPGSKKKKKRGSLKKNDRDGSPRVIFVCSGNSIDSIDAHCMNHYIHGLEHVGRTYNKKTKKSGSLSLKEKLKSKYLRNKSAVVQQNATLSSASKVLTVRAGGTSSDTEEIIQSSDDGHRNKENKEDNKTATLLNRKNNNNNTKQNSDKNNPAVNTLNEDFSQNEEDNIESLRIRTPYKDIFTSKLEFNSENKIKLMQKIKIKKKISKNKRGLKNGIHLATNLRLESALILNLLSSEKFLSMKADDTTDFYSFA